MKTTYKKSGKTEVETKPQREGEVQSALHRNRNVLQKVTFNFHTLSTFQTCHFFTVT